MERSNNFILIRGVIIFSLSSFSKDGKVAENSAPELAEKPTVATGKTFM